MVRRSDEGEAQSRFERDRWTFYEAINFGYLLKADCFFSQVITLLGHALKHSPYILQFYGFTSQRIKFLQTNAEQCFSLMWASYSWRK